MTVTDAVTRTDRQRKNVNLDKHVYMKADIEQYIVAKQHVTISRQYHRITAKSHTHRRWLVVSSKAPLPHVTATRNSAVTHNMQRTFKATNLFMQ